MYSEVIGKADTAGLVDKANCTLEFKGDPGNRVTSQCVSEAALAFVRDKDKLPARISQDGFGTPAEVFGDVLLKRLEKSKVRPVKVCVHVRRGVTRTEYRTFP